MVLNWPTFTRREVCSGVPQSSTLGPLLFSIFINDLDEGIEGVLKFADDTMLGQIANISEDRFKIQMDYDRFKYLALSIKMLFSGKKSKILYLWEGYHCPDVWVSSVLYLPK